MIIARDQYLNKLVLKRNNGLIKVITGIRRSGKSFLLFEIFHNYLIKNGIPKQNIIEVSLEDATSSRYRNPLELDRYIRSRIKNNNQTYVVMLDEIQKVSEITNPYLPDDKIGFVDVLLGLQKLPNVDLYVTGSNSRMLSSDIITEFRGRGDEVRLYPLSYSEFLTSFQGERTKAFREYCTYGGLPLVLSLPTHEEKSLYLHNLFDKTYLKDVIERNHILNDQDVLEELLNIISSSAGSLTNPNRLSNTFKSVNNRSVSPMTIERYLNYFIDAFLIEKAYRYAVKGRKYIGTPLKYYFTDVGLRNARIDFRQYEENHIMENVIYNELKIRGYDVDVGNVELNTQDKNGKKNRTQLEIDFLANKGDKRIYIQSAFTLSDEEKRKQEIRSLIHVPDSFQKIVVVREDIFPWQDEYGIQYIGIEQFLTDNSILLN